MAIFFLVRHGENDWVGKRLAGRTPGVHLNENGKKQAEKLADHFSGIPLKAVYSSPLERARETAAPVASRHDLPLQVCEGLSEIDFGDWQGKTIKQLKRLKLWKTVQKNPQEMQFPNGETFLAARQRLADCIYSLNEQHEDHDLVACFSHSDSIRLLVAHFLNMSLNDFQRLSISTASISIIALSKDHIHVPIVNFSLQTDWSQMFKKQEDKKDNR